MLWSRTQWRPTWKDTPRRTWNHGPFLSTKSRTGNTPWKWSRMSTSWPIRFLKAEPAQLPGRNHGARGGCSIWRWGTTYMPADSRFSRQCFCKVPAGGRNHIEEPGVSQTRRSGSIQSVLYSPMAVPSPGERTMSNVVVSPFL